MVARRGNMSALLREIYQDFRSGLPIAMWAFFSFVLVMTGPFVLVMTGPFVLVMTDPFGTYATMGLEFRAVF